MASGRNLGFDVNASGTALFIIQAVFLALAWITSFMRAFVKLVLLKKVSIDDYLMLVALLGYTVTGYFVFSAVIDGGVGKPPESEDFEITLRNLYGNMVVSGPVSGLVRVSIALFLLRIAVKRWHRIVLHAIMGTTISITVVYFFVILLQCSPPSNFWQRGPASCDHAQTVGTATLVWGSLSAAMDWMLGVLPIAVLWHVRINRQSKVGIVALLSFGIIAGIALVIRLVYIGNTQRIQDIPIAVSAIVELALGIIAGCIATLPPLFKRIGLQLSSNPKRRAVGSIADTIPWQRSFTEPESRQQRTEDIVMTPPRRPEGAQNDRMYSGDGVGGRRPRTQSPLPRRALSSSNWDIDVEIGAAENGESGPRPSGREIQVRTHIHVMSQPSGEADVNVVDFARKPLPLPPQPLRSKPRDRSITRLRPLSPTLFL